MEQTCLELKVAWKPAMEYFGRDVLWNERRVCSRALGIHIPVENVRFSSNPLKSNLHIHFHCLQAVYDHYYHVPSGRKGQFSLIFIFISTNVQIHWLAYCNEAEVAQVGGNRHMRAAAGFEYSQDTGQELGLH